MSRPSATSFGAPSKGFTNPWSRQTAREEEGDAGTFDGSVSGRTLISLFGKA